ncbi:hypothetical protein [Micromonospora sp. 050-3]|uniref:hypothetical protein n=1 Tax=Micromonospora sp. 050-3 TaxID=2789265 RepID=UPI0039787621
MRKILAQAVHVTPEQRATLVEDPERSVLWALAEGPISLLASTWTVTAALPVWAYERLLERHPMLDLIMVDSPWVPQELRTRLWPGESRTAPAEQPPPDRRELEAKASDDNEWVRSTAAADPDLRADLVARLAVDPSPTVRLAVSMRPELTEEQRAAIDYHVGRDDRIQPAAWATKTRDPEIQSRCVRSAHIGLRRSVACNPHLTADHVAALENDDDFAVRLLLCERHSGVTHEPVLHTYLEATTATRGRLLDHPSFQRVGLAQLAESPDPWARALVVSDPEAAPQLIERLSHDPRPEVRNSTAGDPRLSPSRVLDLFDDPETAGAAAANPHLPVSVMRSVLTDAATLANGAVDGEPTVLLGRWSGRRRL